MFSVFLQGFVLQASLILALGAQNIFVLNSALRKQRHFTVALVSSICDAILVFLGVLGVATFFMEYPLLKIALGATGVSFLFFYGFLKIKESREAVKISSVSVGTTTLQRTVWMTLGFSLLNPHVYLDTIVLIGGYSAKFPVFLERFYFGLGASLFSALWFFGLVILASLFSRFLNNAKTMRIVSLLSGVILIALALKLGSDVWGWVNQEL